MKNIFIAILITFSTTVSHAEKIDIPAAIEKAESLPINPDAIGADQYIRSLLLSANYHAHSALFYLEDHPCVASGDCDEWSDYRFIQSKVNYFGSKVIVGSVLVGFFTPAGKWAKNLYEAWTKDGFRNWIKMGALSVSSAVAFLYWNDYVEGLRTLPPEKKEEILNEIELTKEIIKKVDYNVATNVIGSLGIGQFFGYNTVEDMVRDMEELANAMENGPTRD